MRLLISSSPGVGHLLPLLPIARAARDRGHEVAIAVGAGLAPIVVAAGLRHVPVGPATLGEVVRGIPGLAALTGRRRALVTFQRVFCGAIAAGVANDVLALTDTWRPDVIVHEDLELGSWIVAERLGIPHVTVQATAWRPRMRDLAGEPLNQLRATHGLAADPALTGLYGAIFFTTRPPSLRDPAAPLPELTAELRPVADDRGSGPSAGPFADDADSDGDAAGRDPFPSLDDRPRIAVTLGTVNAHQQDVLRMIIDGALAADGHVVVALGADPASFADPPDAVTVREYMPMSTLLPAADLVAFHGGSGTMLAALAAARPMVIVPLAADQPDNADLCAAAGVARIVLLEDLTADAVQTAIEAVVGDPSYRRRAAQVAVEIAAMPGPDDAVARIERLAPSGWGEQVGYGERQELGARSWLDGSRPRR
ncbi:MAG: glycosyltransferase [Candidatus Limnocylindrales bacterium]